MRSKEKLKGEVEHNQEISGGKQEAERIKKRREAKPKVEKSHEKSAENAWRIGAKLRKKWCEMKWEGK